MKPLVTDELWATAGPLRPTIRYERLVATHRAFLHPARALVRRNYLRGS